jgi:hypothetical protein
MATSFAANIKPYFTDCYRKHMLFFCDLWSADDVQSNWQDIYDRVSDGSMPRAGCPEGVWDKTTQQKFLSDFTDWQNANYPP